MEGTAVSNTGNGVKRRPPPRPRAAQATVQKVYDRMADQDRKIDHVASKVDMYAITLQRVEGKMDRILTVVGEEAEDGQGGHVGTGLVGRMRRVEGRQNRLDTRYRQWISWGAGFCTCLTVMTAVIWWLIADKLEVVFRG